MELSDIASKEYRDVLMRTHKQSKWGNDGKHHVKTVIAFAGKIGAASILDYGCGRGSLIKVMRQGNRVHPEFDLREWDPGVKGKDALPSPADLVVCTDVLEHVEPELLVDVIKHIFDMTNKGAFLLISCRLARTILADGRNAHLIVQSPSWWLAQLGKHAWLVDVAIGKEGHSVRVWLRKGNEQ